MSRTTIQGAWESYRALVVAADATEQEVRELRAAFWSGASLVIDRVLMAAVRATDDEEGVELIDGLAMECRDFTREMLAAGLASGKAS